MDVSRGPYDIGFPFSFYGQVYNRFYIAKGMLPLLVGTDSWTPRCIPSQGTPNGFIAGFWEDVWAMNNLGHLFWKQVGSAPNRMLVVEWLNVGTYYGTRSGMTFEIVLLEGSNDILFQYQTMSGHFNGKGRLATVGIENQTGEVGLQVSCRQEWITDGSAVHIYCPGQAGTPTPTRTQVASATPTRTRTPTLTPTDSGTTVRMDPNASTLALGGMANVDVAISQVTDLGGFEFTVRFNPAVVRVDAVAMGSFLTGSGRTFTALGPTIDNAAGTVSYGGYSIGAQPVLSGSGPLARITFSSVAMGNSDLHLENVSLTTPAAAQIAFVTADGTIQVQQTLIGDMDGDCDVDIVDIMLVAGRWGSHSGDADYDARYDLDNDGDIDITDVMTVVAHWGERCVQGTPSGVRPFPHGRLPGPEMDLQPGSNTVRPGDVFGLEVRVQGANDLGGVEFTLQYNPAILRVESVDLGGMLKNGARTYTVLGPDIDNALGTAHFAAYSVGATPPGPGGAGTVAIVMMRAVALGNARVDFAAQPPAQITKTLGAKQEPLTLVGADVTVSEQAGEMRLFLPAIVKRSGWQRFPAAGFRLPVRVFVLFIR